jgi:hypothetical protein
MNAELDREGGSQRDFWKVISPAINARRERFTSERRDPRAEVEQ